MGITTNLTKNFNIYKNNFCNMISFEFISNKINDTFAIVLCAFLIFSAYKVVTIFCKKFKKNKENKCKE